MLYNYKMELQDKLKNLTILFAEDDKIARESIYNALCVFCNTVLLATNGAEALKLYSIHSPHIIILDIEMPILNGLDVAKEIRLTNDTVPIIVVTNHLQTDYLLSAVKLNLVDYLAKPISFDKLKIALSECVNKLEQSGMLTYKICEDTHYNFVKKDILRCGDTINLTRQEFQLIELLIKKRGMLVTYEMIESIYDECISQDSIKSLIYRLKQKIGKNIIINVKNIGYCIK